MGWREDAVQRGHERAWELKAKTDVTWVDSLGGETDLVAVARDVRPESGLDVGSDGVARERVLVLIFIKSYLATLGVTIEPTGYFELDGERWDLMKGAPILDYIGPLGNHPVIEVTVRRARETESAAETFELSIEE